ncbi:MAG TPA: hypothetical protein PKE27_08395, partial [Povalibacter sp.]
TMSCFVQTLATPPSTLSALATQHYETQLEGLGNEFLLEAVLVELPSLGEKLDPTHRRLPLQRFPHALIFRRDADIIRVVAVAHRRRRPRYWSPRVQER